MSKLPATASALGKRLARGHTVDGIRLLRRRPSQRQIKSWPPGTRIVDTSAGKIRVRDTGGKRPVVVMVPDGPCVIEHYNTLVSELADSFRVVCFDLPGFGFSYPRVGYDFGLAQTADVVIAVLDALDIRRATLSFSCANGFYALATALVSPERVQRLVLCQTPSVAAMHAWVERSIPRPLRMPFVGQAMAALLVGKLASTWFDIALPRDSAVKNELRDQSRAALRAGACFCLASVVQGLAGATESALAGVQVPTTMIWGDKDWSHKNTDLESFRELVPDCTIEVFDGCGHFPNLERPREFASRLEM